MDELAPDAERMAAARALVFALLPVARRLDEAASDLAVSVVEAFERMAGVRLVDGPERAAERALSRLWAMRAEGGGSSPPPGWHEALASFALSLASAYAVYAAEAAARAALGAEELLRAPA